MSISCINNARKQCNLPSRSRQKKAHSHSREDQSKYPDSGGGRPGEAMSWGAREGAMEHVRQNTNKKTVGKSLARDDDDDVFNLVARTSDSEPASASAGYGPKEILH